MKKINLLFALFFSVVSFAQVTKLESLSSSKFLNSKIIYEEDEDVYGYFLLYEKDKKGKDIFELEYIILDKNLNKLSSNTFLQYFEPSSYFKKGLNSVIKKGDFLYINLGNIQSGSEGVNSTLVTNVRILNLKNYELSNAVEVSDFKIIKSVNSGDMPIDFNKKSYIQITKNDGFIVYNQVASKSFTQDRADLKSTKGLRFYDLNFNFKWEFNYNNTKEKSFCSYQYVQGRENDIVFLRAKYDDVNDKQIDYDYVCLDSNTGKLKFEIDINDNENSVSCRKINFENDKIIIYGATSLRNESNIFDIEKNTGYVSIVIDRKLVER